MCRCPSTLIIKLTIVTIICCRDIMQPLKYNVNYIQCLQTNYADKFMHRETLPRRYWTEDMTGKEQKLSLATCDLSSEAREVIKSKHHKG